MIIEEDAGLAAEQERQAEAEWIKRARNGDDSAWDRLVNSHQEPAYRFAYLKLGDAADAEDVVQEAFVRAFLSLDRFEIGRPFRPWLMAITINLARNRRRSIGRYFHNLRRLIEREPEPVRLHHYGENLQAKREAHQLWQAVQKLNQKGQEVVYLRYFLEMSELEMAETLDIAPGTVKSRLHRALKELQGVVEREYPELGDDYRDS